MNIRGIYKKIYYIIFFTLSSLTMLSCTQAEVLATTGEDVNMAINLQTRSLSDENALTGEETLTNVYVFIYNSNYILENGSDLSVTAGNLASKRWVVKEGIKHVYVIANPDAELQTRLAAKPSRQELLSMITNASSFDASVSNIPTKGILMAGKAESKQIAQNTATIDISLERKMARVDFYLRKEANVSGSLVVKSVTLENTRKAGKLYDETNSYTYPIANINAGTLTTTSGVVVTAVTSAPATDNTYTFVSYNYSFTNKLGSSFVETDVNKLNITIAYTESGYTMTYNYVLYLSTNNTYGSSLSIVPNSVYQVKATIYKEGITLSVNGVTTITNSFVIS